MITIPRYVQQIPLWSFFYMFLVKKIEFPENFLFFNSGRGTLKWLLVNQKILFNKILNVGMPCYSCYTVYQSISESGNEVTLLDIDPLCFSISDTLYEQIKKLDVLIWINYFGFKYTKVLKRIRTEFPDLLIVEDCSHVDLRDYLKVYMNESYSDYSVFSFNFRKPITAGGGGLLIPNETKNKTVNHNLYESYKLLTSEKLSANKIIKILIYNFSYNYLIFLILNKLISRKRQKPFNVEQIPVVSFTMNRTLKRLFYTQYLRKSEKINQEKITLNYFNNISENVNEYSFGTLCYYPINLLTDHDYSIGNNVDAYMLWDNLLESFRFFKVKIIQEYYPLTFSFLYNSIFLPPGYFKKVK